MPEGRAPGRAAGSTGGTNPALPAAGTGPRGAGATGRAGGGPEHPDGERRDAEAGFKGGEAGFRGAGPGPRDAGRAHGGGLGNHRSSADSLERTLRLHRLYDLYRGLLTPRQQDVFELYHWQDLSLGEVAEHLGISRQAVHDLLRRSETLLEETEGALGLGAWRQRATGHLDRLEALLAAAAADAAQAAAPVAERLREALQVLAALRHDLQAGPTGAAGSHPGAS